MRPWTRAGLALLLVAPAMHAAAQDATGDAPRSAPRATAREEVLEAAVTAVVPDGVYLDRGSDAGVAVGDRVTLLPLAGAGLEGTVRLVSRAAARVEIPGGADGVQVGDRAEVRITRRPPPARDGAPEVPPHPPWTGAEGPWPDDLPLLAPVSARAPEERDTTYTGRAYVRAEAGTDDETGTEWSLLWVGGKLDVTNPLGRGGELTVDVDAFTREVDESAGSDADDRVRIDRLAYSIGGDRARPDRLNLGRFLHEEMPELGVLDGVAWDRRLPSGDHVGASVGFLTDWDDGAGTGNNAGVSAWYRFNADDERTLTSALALQKTWYQGDADRDLVVWTSDWRPFERTSLHASAWVDLYGSGDTRSGAELTQALLTATQRLGDASGLSLTATKYAWPELLRDDLFDPDAEDLLDIEVSRVSLRGWHDLSESYRVDGRVTSFSDQDDSGGSAEVGVRARDVLWSRGSASLHVYNTAGKYTDGFGVRGSATRTFDLGTLRFDFDATDYDGGGLAGSAGSLAHERVRLSWDMDLGTAWSLAVHAEQRLGDQQDSQTLGFYLQRRF